MNSGQPALPENPNVVATHFAADIDTPGVKKQINPESDRRLVGG
jgi:hypothetical protein